MAIASFIIGAITIFSGLQSLTGTFFRIPFLSFFGAGNIFSMPLNIAGLVLGIIAVRKKDKHGIAVAGIILNALGILIFAAIMAMWSVL
jgi:hypothetical protein